MGGCVGKSFTVNKKNKEGDYRSGPTLFCRHHLERLLLLAEPGEYLLYRDLESEHILLTVRMQIGVRHYRISEMEDLFWMQGQPYPYLDSILLYHRRHKLNGVKLLRQVYINARDVRSFAQRVAETNGNFQMFENKNTAAAATAATSTSTAPTIVTPAIPISALPSDGGGGGLGTSRPERSLSVTTLDVRRHSRTSPGASQARRIARASSSASQVKRHSRPSPNVSQVRRHSRAGSSAALLKSSPGSANRRR